METLKLRHYRPVLLHFGPIYGFNLISISFILSFPGHPFFIVSQSYDLQ